MIATVLGLGRPRGILRRVDWALGHLLSFEAAFVLFIYSNELKTISPVNLPVDETVVGAALALGAGGLVVLREGVSLRGLPVLVSALAFLLWAAASAAWTPSQHLVDKSVAYLLTFTVMSIAAGALIIGNRRERVVRFLALALGVALIMALYGLYIYAVYGDFRRWAGWADFDGRVYLAFGHTVVNGAGIAFAMGLFARFGSTRQGVAAALFLVCSVFLLVGGGRGPFLGAVLAALVGLACRPPTLGRGRLEIPYATVAAVCVLALAAAYVAYLLSTGNVTTTLARFAKLTSEGSSNAKLAAATDRLDFYAAAYSFWLQAPVFGNGLDSFPMLFLGEEREGFHPHNIILQILSELGLVGLLLFLAFFWTAFRHASYRRLRRDPLMVCALLFLITSSMSALFGRDIVGVRKFFFAISLLAMRPPARAAEAGEEEVEEEPAPRLPPRRYGAGTLPQTARGA